MQSGAYLSEQEALFLSVTEQLVRPFLQIARISELADQEQWQTVRTIADSYLQIAESYALSLRAHGKITPLKLEPIAVSALLYDTAHSLSAFAKQYGVELEVDAGTRQQPIIADRTILQSAMISLGQVFVLAQSESDDMAPVRLSAHKSRYGVVAGMYGSASLGAESLRKARLLQGKAHQPISQLVSGPAAGVFVADSLLQVIKTRLHVAKYHNLTGLAATLPSSSQLQLV